MKTLTINHYQINELSEEARQNAIEEYKNNQTFEWIFEEAFATVKAFAEIFNFDIYQIDFCEMYRSEWRLNLDDNIKELTGLRLQKYIWNNYRDQIYEGKYYGKLVDTFPDGSKIPISKEHPIGKRHVKRYSRVFIEMDNCPLTGCCYDCSILQPIEDFLKRPNDKQNFEDLLNDCLHSIAKDVNSEIEARNEDAAIIEEIEANELWFNEEGEKV